MKHLFTIVFLFFSLNAYSQEDNLLYSSYVGGSSTDGLECIATDQYGNIYFYGYSKSNNFPTTNNAYQKGYSGGGSDLVLMKYTSDMKVVWATYIGGNDVEYPKNIKCNKDYLWIAADTRSKNFPVTNNAFQKNHNSDYDGAILKFSLDGELLYSSFIGSRSYDVVDDLVIDNDENVWFTGRVYSSDFPITKDAEQNTFLNGVDSFISKIDKNGQLVYSSFLGGNGDDFAMDIALNKNSNLIAITGYTTSSDYPIIGQALFPKKMGSGFDTFVTFFNMDGKKVWSSFFGGTGNDFGEQITENNEGGFFFRSFTNSKEIMTSFNTSQKVNPGDYSSYLANINEKGEMLWGSFFGGNQTDSESNINNKGGGLSVRKNGDIIISGYTRSKDIPISNNAYQSTLKGTMDVAIAIFNDNGDLKYCSYLGGAGNEEGRDILFTDDKLIVTGWTQSNDFPTTSDALYPNLMGGQAGFISVFGISDFCKEEFNSDNGFSKLKLHTNKPIFEEDAFRLTSLYEFDLGYMFYDEKVNLAGGFQSEFSFLFSGGTEDAIKRSIIPTGILADSSLPGADGVAFIISGSLPTEFRGDGGGIGYNGISNAIAIEIDLWGNNEYSDPNGNHLAVQIPDRKGVLKTKHTDETTVYMNKDIVTILSDSTQSYTCRIEYQNHNLKIYLNESDKPSTLIVELTDFPLEEYITLDKGSNGYVGLTSSTGIAAEYHDILHWDLCALRDPQVVNSVLSEKSNDITVYPNPMDDILSIDLPAITTEELTIVVTDYLGRKVYSRNTNALSNKLELNLSSLLSGVYNISIIEGTNNIYTTKIVKR